MNGDNVKEVREMKSEDLVKEANGFPRRTKQVIAEILSVYGVHVAAGIFSAVAVLDDDPG